MQVKKDMAVREQSANYMESSTVEDIRIVGTLGEGSYGKVNTLQLVM